MSVDLFLTNPEVQPADLRLRVRSAGGVQGTIYSRIASEAGAAPVGTARRSVAYLRRLDDGASLPVDVASRTATYLRRLEGGVTVVAVADRTALYDRSSGVGVLTPTDVASRKATFLRRLDGSAPVSLDVASRSVAMQRPAAEVVSAPASAAMRVVAVLRAAGDVTPGAAAAASHTTSRTFVRLVNEVATGVVAIAGRLVDLSRTVAADHAVLDQTAARAVAFVRPVTSFVQVEVLPTRTAHVLRGVLTSVLVPAVQVLFEILTRRRPLSLRVEAVGTTSVTVGTVEHLG